MTLQLLTFPGCPNAAAARAVVKQALDSLGLDIPIEEVDVTASDTPLQLKRWGSPTILVDGRDVAQGEPSGASCRVYRTSDGRSAGSPELGLVVGHLVGKT